MGEGMSLLDLLNSKDPAVAQGLLQAGLSLLQSRGSLAPAIGRAGQAGTIGAQAYRNQTLWQQQQGLENKLLQSRMAEQERSVKEREAAALRRLEIDQYLQGLQPVTGTQANAATGITGPRPEAAAAIGQRPPIDPIQAMRMLGPDVAKQLFESKNWGRPEVARTVETDAGIQQLDKFGGQVGGALPRYVAPVQVNRGGSIDFVKPAAGVSLPVSMSPDQMDASRRGWANVGLTRRGQDMADARARDLAEIKRSEVAVAAEAKKTADADKQVSGKKVVDDVVASLRLQYDSLDKAGGITNPTRGALSNLTAGLQSSETGQAVGRMFGTANQSARNTILQQRPALLSAIMKATGMSAKQLDSNAELKLMLSTATDPTLDVAANRRALDLIEQLYGTGSTPRVEPPASGGPAPGMVQDGYRFKGGNPADPNSWEPVK